MTVPSWDDLSPEVRERLESMELTEERFNELGQMHQEHMLREVPWDELPADYRQSMREKYDSEHFDVEKEWEANRIEKQSIGFCAELEPRTISTRDLETIMEAAEELRLNRQLDPSVKTWLDPEGVHVFKSVMVHQHALGKIVDPHVRGYIYLKALHSDKPEEAMIDIPMELYNVLQTATDYSYTHGLPTGDEDWDSFVKDFWRVVEDGEASGNQSVG